MIGDNKQLLEKIAIVILNYNGEKDTLECIDSLANIRKENFDLLVVVVDNGKEKLKIKPACRAGRSAGLKVLDLKIIWGGGNLGFAKGNNVGITYALNKGADYVFILNNDTVVDKNLFRELLKVIKSDTKIGIVSPKIYFFPGFEFHKNRYKKNDLGKVIWYAGGLMDWANIIGKHRGVDEVDNRQYENICETDFATGCAMFVKREVFEKIGLFDERYFLYYEDSDFSIRARRSGFKIMFVPASSVWHKNAGSAGGSGSNLQDYYITRNRLLFASKYAGFRAKFALFRQCLKYFLTGSFWKRRAVLDFYFHRFGKAKYFK